MSNKLYKQYLRVLHNELQYCYPTLPATPLSLSEEEQLLCTTARQLATGGIATKAGTTFSYLQSSFDNIIFKENKQPFDYTPKHKGFLAQELKFDDLFFPEIVETPNQQSIQTVWSAIQAAIETAVSTNLSLANVDTFLYQLERYASFVPSNLVTKEGNKYAPDISLYDHVRSVAAFANCIAEYSQSTGKSLQELQDNDSEQAFLLVAGDTSGIQQFIYDIIGAKASRNLKGRSFYIQLLNESVLFQLLPVQGYARAHLVYSSGGNFYILLPNTKQVKEYIQTIQIDLSNSLFETYKTQLYFALTTTPFSIQELLVEEGFSNIWKATTTALKQVKRQRYTHHLYNDFNQLFEPIEQGGTKPRDAITNEEFTKDELKELEEERKHSNRQLIHYLNESKKEEELADTIPNRKQAIRLLTNSQILLGKALGKADYFITTSASVEKFATPRMSFQNEFTIGTFPVYHYLIASEELDDFLSALAGYEGTIRLLKFNYTNLEELTIPNDLTKGFILYGGNRFPIDPETGYAKNFEQLAGDGPLKRLGVLRMDVDSLGQIFVSGTAAKQKSFAAYSSLSRALDIFFKGQLNLIWREDSFKEDTYILYSGGDDLFLLGRWDKVLAFGKRIKEGFQKWTCNNPSFTISGGMVMVGNKFPIAQSAEMAETALDIAKNYTYKYPSQTAISKDAIHFLDHTFNWEEEFTMLEELQKTWLNLVHTKEEEQGETIHPPLSRAILSKISELRQLQAKETAQNLNPTWLWLSTYHLSQTASRIRQRNPKAMEAKSFLDSAKKNIAGNTYNNKKLNKHYTFLELLHLAARWTEFDIRTKQE